MKKIYTQPLIVFEDFSLSTNIASGCDGIVGNPSKDSCALMGTGGVAVFTGSVSACDFTPGDLGAGNKDEYDGFCYNNPTEYNNLFNS